MNWPYLGRITVVVAFTAAALWTVGAATLSNQLAQRTPELVAAWAGSAEARGRAAFAIVQRGQSPAELAAARELATAALRREPLNVAAVRTLAVVAALRRDDQRARRLLAYAESLSRRDLPTQLMLIEDSVRRNDIPETLRHYDRALTTSSRTADFLLPILVRATAEPAIAANLAAMVASRPPWWPAFLDRMSAESTAPASLAIIADRLRLDVSDPTERQLLSNAMARLVALGDHQRALALYSRAYPDGGANLLLRDGGFEAQLDVPPFGWLFTDEPGLSGVRAPVSNGGSGNALFLTAAGGSAGIAARQLLVLAPGRYRLTLLAGGVGGDSVARPSVVVACASAGETMLNEMRLPDAPAEGRPVSDDFLVPQNCPAQYLSVRMAAPLDQERQTATWVDQFVLTRQ